MRAIDRVFCELESAFAPTPLPLFLARSSPFDVVLPSFSDSSRKMLVPYIRVLFRPVSNFCDGMAYKQMETDDPDVSFQEVDLEVCAALVEHLKHIGQTETDVLEEMYKKLDMVREYNLRIRYALPPPLVSERVPISRLTPNRYKDPLAPETLRDLSFFLMDYGVFHPIIVGNYNIILVGEMLYSVWKAAGFKEVSIVKSHIEVKYIVPWWKRLWRETRQNKSSNGC